MMASATRSALNEDEFVALVERIQQAMCIEPFHPDVTDVVVLIGTCRMLDREIKRLRDEGLRLAAQSSTESVMLQAENERLRAGLAESEAENDQWQKKLAETWAEVERLRADNDLAANELVEYAKLAAAGTAEQQQEIKRLRAVLDEIAAEDDE